MTNTRINADHANDVATITADTASNTTATAAGSNWGRNLLINGDFSVWQRGVGPFSSAEYTSDRWFYNTSGSTGTVDQATHTLGQTDVPGNPRHYLEFDVTASSDFASVFQRIENVESTAGREVTVSFYAKGVNPGGGNIGLRVAQNFGTGGGSSSVNTDVDETLTLTASWQRFEITFTPPSISGKTIGTGGNDYFAVFIGQITDTSTDAWNMDISNVQLEFGDTATEFEYVSPADQLVRCLRYFENRIVQASGLVTTAQAYSATSSQGTIDYGIKRGIPTISLDSGAIKSATATGTTNNATVVFDRTGVNNTRLVATTTGLVAGNASNLTANGEVSLYIDAEL